MRHALMHCAALLCTKQDARAEAAQAAWHRALVEARVKWSGRRRVLLLWVRQGSTHRVTPEGGGHDGLGEVRLHVVAVAAKGIPCTSKPKKVATSRGEG